MGFFSERGEKKFIAAAAQLRTLMGDYADKHTKAVKALKLFVKETRINPDLLKSVRSHLTSVGPDTRSAHERAEAEIENKAVENRTAFNENNFLNLFEVAAKDLEAGNPATMKALYEEAVRVQKMGEEQFDSENPNFDSEGYKAQVDTLNTFEWLDDKVMEAWKKIINKF